MALMLRYSLDRRRVEDAYYQYALLRICSWYPSILRIEDLPLHSNTADSIQSIMNLYHEAFMRKYCGKGYLCIKCKHS